ncbi:MAG: acylneuraminate cytidylyltransferase family protein [Minisyncoccia bacterium]
MDAPKILALIPARGGSKGIPKKNIRPFCGKPLIAYSIDVAKNAPSVDRVVVTTDSEEIASVAKEFGAEVPTMRPPELAEDKSPVMGAVIHMLDHLRDTEKYEPSHVLLLQTTSPLREVSDIEAAVQLLTERGGDSLVSLCRTENGLYTKDAGDTLETLYDGYASTNRQMLPKTYKLDGCMIYLIKTEMLRRERSFLGGKCIGYEIERWRAVDLDDPQDFVTGELLYKNREMIAEHIKEFS